MAATGGVIALDLSGKVGWCIGRLPAVPMTPIQMKAAGLPQPMSGVYRIPETLVGPYLSCFRNWITAMIVKHGIAGVIFESPVLPSKTSVQTVRKLMSLAGMTQMVAHECGIAWVREARPSTVKLHFCGHGGGGKERMIAEAIARGYSFQTDDEVDAIALWIMAADLFYRERMKT